MTHKYGQTKKHSVIESIANTTIGYIIAIGTQMIIFPLFDIHVDMWENFVIAALFTVISLVRSYIVRRMFNWFHLKQLLTIEWQSGCKEIDFDDSVIKVTHRRPVDHS